MTDVAAALRLLMQRLAVTAAQWQAETEARENAEAERDEVEYLHMRLSEGVRERDEARAALAASQAREREQLALERLNILKERDAVCDELEKTRAALRGLLSRPFAKPGWSPEWDALVDAARAALAEEGP